MTGDERAVTGEAGEVLALCRARNWRLATAESCTGGLVAARLTDIPGASDVYVGGIVAYSDDVKRKQLAVPAETLQTYGAVSMETVAAMAAGVRRALNADIAVAVTGIAGPSGGTPEKPVGLVFISVDCVDGNSTGPAMMSGDREAIRNEATTAALYVLHRVLTDTATNTRA